MIEHIGSGVVHIDFLGRGKSGSYRLEGYYNGELNSKGCSLIVKTKSVSLEPKTVKRPDLEKQTSTEITRGFVVDLDVMQDDEISFIMADKDGKETKLQIHTGLFTRISPLFLSYRYDEADSRLFRNHRKKITVRPANALRRTVYELTFLIRLLFYWRINNVKAALKGIFSSNEKRSLKKVIFETMKPLLIIAESIILVPRAYVLRISFFYQRSKKERPVWIISDRGMSAGDNGEALYRYITEKRLQPETDIYFVLSKKSKDYDRLKSLAGKRLLDQDSLCYKLKFLLADKIISSHADIEVTNPFLRQRYHFQDLMNHQFVFLQHGIIRHDHSSWLNRFHKDISLFVTSAKKEYDSILEYDYGYEAGKVALTGLPRFDYLESAPQGKIILAPTYRRELARLPTDKNGARPYDPEFKHSEYFKTYSRVMGDQKLRKALEQSNMTMELYLHPNLHAQAVDFSESEVVRIKDYPYSYKEAFRQGDVLITDYSSVSFDFAYLKKPLVYYQFDQDTFFKHSLSEKADFFSDSRDGFGPVITDHDALVEELCLMMKTKKMEKKYQERVDEFFYKIDKRNSQRVYEAIASMDVAV